MEETKKQLQEKVTRWVEIMKQLAAERNECLNNGTEFKKEKALCEYRGRIYASRSFAEMLGIEINSEFIN